MRLLKPSSSTPSWESGLSCVGGPVLYVMVRTTLRGFAPSHLYQDGSEPCQLRPSLSIGTGSAGNPSPQKFVEAVVEEIALDGAILHMVGVALTVLVAIDRLLALSPQTTISSIPCINTAMSYRPV